MFAVLAFLLQKRAGIYPTLLSMFSTNYLMFNLLAGIHKFLPETLQQVLPLMLRFAVNLQLFLPERQLRVRLPVEVYARTLALLNERVDNFFKTTRLPFFLAILPLLIVNAVVINNGSSDHLGRIFNDPILEVKNFNAFFKHKIKLFKSCSLNLKLPLSFKSGTAT